MSDISLTIRSLWDTGKATGMQRTTSRRITIEVGVSTMGLRVVYRTVTCTGPQTVPYKTEAESRVLLCSCFCMGLERIAVLIMSPSIRSTENGQAMSLFAVLGCSIQSFFCSVLSMPSQCGELRPSMPQSLLIPMSWKLSDRSVLFLCRSCFIA